MTKFIGVMSGTSLDGIDIAIVDLSDQQFSLLAAKTVPFPRTLYKSIYNVLSQESVTLNQLGQTDIALGQAYSEAINSLLSETNIKADEITAIGCHGQTICHSPNSAHPFTIQIGNAHVVAELTGITTVADFRQRDMVLGGQGAPLVPAFHQNIFHHNQEDRVIANIGGIANITVLPANSDLVTGFDTGPGNVLMDEWYQQHHKDSTYDNQGAWAKSADVDEALLKHFFEDPYFALPIPKSTGREYFNLDWLLNKLNGFAYSPAPNVVQATLLQLTAQSLCNDISTYMPTASELFICGGGAYNTALIEVIKSLMLNMRVETTEALGLSPDWVEACAFAWLAKRTLQSDVGNIPSVTGASKPTILGTITPANKR